VEANPAQANTVESASITTLEELKQYLYAALQLEHATIPPYLTALYSLRPGTNPDAWHILRVVVVEEMLHLSLAANVMNAIGGTVDLTDPDFVPLYPAFLPDGEQDFSVDLQPFSERAVDTFLQIERPRQAPDESKRVVRRAAPLRRMLAVSPKEPGMQFYSIGEFYQEIDRGLRYLHGQYTREGKELFTGDPARQVTSEYFYSGGGEVLPVTGLGSAVEALALIAGQGEGLGGGIYDSAGELAHFYRFQQLKLGRFYQKGDEPGQPTGPDVHTDWTAAYPTMTNPTLENYPAGSELHQAAREFNESYAYFLAFLTRAFGGQPELLLDAVPRMFRLRNDIGRLIRNPVPGRPGVNAAPTFEMPAATGEQGEGSGE
jgi:hypothetical protein